MSELEARAASLGVLTRYVGADGETHHARPDALEAVLEPLATYRNLVGETPLPSVIVQWDDSPVVVEIPEPATEARLVLESGPHRSLAPDSKRIVIPNLPPGYHEIRVVFAAGASSVAIIVAPTRCFRPAEAIRQWGLFAPVYALDRGTFSDLSRLCEIVASHGGGFAGTLPLLPTFDDEPSPYSPVSRCFWNERFIDDAARSEDFPSPPARSDARFLDAYARFRAFCEDDPGRYDFYFGAQREAEKQMSDVAERARELGVSLYLDLPLGVHPRGFDVAHDAWLYARGVTVGAPPDALFEGGQNWSFPPCLPEASRRSGHAMFRRAVRHHMRHAGILRVDHVMGLHRQFWIPSGFHARDGVYVTYPAEELYAVLSLESHRARCVVVGENLGTVPPEVDASLLRHGILGLYVLQFGLAGGRPPADTMASIDTHDTPTFAGFCRGGPPERRDAVRAFDRRLGLSPESSESARLEAWLTWLLESDAAYVNIMLEDLWLETDPQNVPGTTTERGNWVRKLRHRLGGWPPEVEALLRRLAAKRRSSP